MSKNSQRCPRRAESPNPSAFGGDKPTPDSWIKRTGIRRCSYCGSIHPDDFMEYARQGTATLGPTDKSYKVYVKDPDVTYRPKSYRYETGKKTNVTKYPLTTEHMKFYFQHLSPEQQDEFIELYNVRPHRRYDDAGQFTVEGESTGKMAVGYPGYFYRLPFFATSAAR